jgi:hypothetical protein
MKKTLVLKFTSRNEIRSISRNATITLKRGLEPVIPSSNPKKGIGFTSKPDSEGR